MLPDINFQTIRVLNGSQNKGFEELCYQILAASVPPTSKIDRVDDGGGDGGVEAVAHLRDGSRIGIQAKYFPKLEQSQFTQINKSVLSALETHAPNLTEYRVLCPRDRNPSNIRSWENYCKKWAKAAEDCGYTQEVEFVWVGGSELRKLLQELQYRNHLYYWFGSEQFSLDWLNDIFLASRALLHARYSPDLNITTSIQSQLGAFFDAPQFRDELERKKRPCYLEALKCQSLAIPESTRSSNYNSALKKFQNTLAESVNHTLVGEFLRVVIALQDAIFNLSGELARHGTIGGSRDYGLPPERVYGHQLRELDKFYDELAALKDFLVENECYDNNELLLTGEAGTGKSHLLAQSTESALQRLQPALLLLGEQFGGKLPVVRQISQLVGWKSDEDALLSALAVCATLAEKPAIIVIDAVNETIDRDTWRTILPPFLTKLKGYPQLKLLFSCRSDFISITLPPEVASKARDTRYSLRHTGYGENVFEAITKYFQRYGVQSPTLPPPLAEFRNPLFLKMFCEAFEDSFFDASHIGLDQIMRRRLDVAFGNVQVRIDCPIYKSKKAIEAIADRIAENGGGAVPANWAQDYLDQIFSGDGLSSSLYAHLRSAGLLVEAVHPIGGRPTTMVRFPYERFSEYLVADRILGDAQTFAELKKRWEELGFIEKWSESLSPFENENGATHVGVLRMLAILLPERFQIEFVDLVPESIHQYTYLEHFLSSIEWRTARSITPRSWKLLESCQAKHQNEFLLEKLLRIIAIPNHPWNADYYDKLLSAMELPEREMAWNTLIIDLYQESRSNALSDILAWTFHSGEQVMNAEQKRLIAVFLIWITGTSWRSLRKRTVIAAIVLLKDSPDLIPLLVAQFGSCNDPYIVEAVYAVAAGVALRCNDISHLEEIAKAVNSAMFSRREVDPHILQRDYCLAILDYAEYRNALPKGINRRNSTIPLHSVFPKIPSEKSAKEIEGQDGWYTISHSLQPEGSGFYGDFGRYTMEAYTHAFLNRKLKGRPSASEKADWRFDGFASRRYILGRIAELGWSPERFNGFDERLSSLWMSSEAQEGRIERIGKKYQWIGLFELMGYLSDHHRMNSSYGDEFKGAWQTFARKFDPTRPLIDPESDRDLGGVATHSWWRPKQLDPFEDTRYADDRVGWVNYEYETFEPLLRIEPGQLDGNEWFSLSASIAWKEKIKATHDVEALGRLELWIHSRCWIVKQDDVEAFLRDIEHVQFYGMGLELPSTGDGWVGEYPWGACYAGLEEECERNDCLLQRRSPKVAFHQTACSYNGLGNDRTSLVPSPLICKNMALHWGGRDLDFCDALGRRICFTPNERPFDFNSPPLLVRSDSFQEMLSRNSLCAIWGIVSERSCSTGGFNDSGINKVIVTDHVYQLDQGQFRLMHRRNYSPNGL